MKYPIIIIIIILTLLITSLSKEKNPNFDKTRLRSFADSLFNVNIENSQIAGASVLVFQKNELLIDNSYGYANLELSVPMPPHASFEIGSVTKQFTAAAILKLAEQGKLSLSEDFTKYIRFDTKGRKVTIAHLLNHTSGIPGYTELPEIANLLKLSMDRDTLVRIVEKKDFLFEPGDALIYNNSAYFILGLIIIKVSGMKYIDYLNDQFFKPLGMANTYYCSNGVVVKNKAYGYSYSKAGLQQREYLDHIWPFAAGSLCSTSEDLLKWMKALHQGKVLSKNQYSLMITPGKLNDGSPLRYSMGITNYQLYGNRQIGHGGGINGFLAETLYFPDDDLYVICLVNTTGPMSASYFSNQLTWKMLKKKEDVPVKVDLDIIPFAGKYSGQARGRILSVDLHIYKDKLVLKTAGKAEADTLKIYVGNNTWSRGNDRITIKNNKVHVDNVIGHFVLTKVKE